MPNYFNGSNSPLTLSDGRVLGAGEYAELAEGNQVVKHALEMGWIVEVDQIPEPEAEEKDEETKEDKKPVPAAPSFTTKIEKGKISPASDKPIE